jgi:hypothetical protein
MPRKANALPSGGGGGGWAKMNEDMARNRAAIQRVALTYAKGRSVDDPDLDDVSRKLVEQSSGTSIFDPVLTELAYRWFCPPGGMVLDPFAGGSVRGIVASKLGRRYFGVDLSGRQIAANAAQAEAICDDPKPRWREGDAIDLPKLAKGIDADFVFSCPPYGDLERYSDDPRDLSTMEWDAFVAAYRAIIAAACARLRADRFACFVVGDIRDTRSGAYRGLPWQTVAAFTDAGLALYNEAVLVTAAGSLPIRAGKQFATTRKLGKTHQNVLVFVKGDARVATEAIGPCDFGDPEQASAPEADEFGERITVADIGGAA